MKKESSYFDTWSTELYGSDLIFQRTIHSFTEGVVRGDTLDIGCGSRVWYNVGDVTRWVGLDVSQAMLNDLRFYGSSRPAQVETILTSCLDAKFPAESFDTVCAIFVLHHLAQESTGLSRDRVGTMMRKAFRYLKPGGRFLIAENAAKALEWPYHMAYRPLYWIFRQSKAIELPHFWSTRQLLGMLGAAGFDDTVFVHLPIRERISNPMSGFALPPFLVNLMQEMTLFVATKPGNSERHLTRPES